MRLHRLDVSPVPPSLLPGLSLSLAGEGPHPFWLDSGDSPGPHARWWAMGVAPRRVVAAPASDLGDLLAGLVETVGPADSVAPLWVGLIAYEAGQWAEPRIPRAPAPPGEGAPLPDVWWARYGAVVVGQVGGERCEVVGDDPAAVARLGALVRRVAAGRGVEATGEQRSHLRRAVGASRGGAAPPLIGSLIPAQTDAAVAAGIERVLEAIRAGEIYQANVTRRFTGRLADGATAADLFVRLRALGPVPYAALLDPGPAQVVSLSPECFLRVDLHGRSIETFPIKGTRPRGATRREDAALATALRSDPKELAEHVMIVDLERNDLGRVCVPGSITVAERWPVVAFPGVHHLVSRVRGTLDAGTGLADVLRASFPCGSITGAPKVRACRIIAEVEAEARGVYCGAIGWVDPRGRAGFSVPIRTGTVRGRTLQVHAGGGIVADSDPARELAEGRLKLRTWERATGAGGRGPRGA